MAAEGIIDCVQKVDAGGVIAVCSYGGMPPEDGARNQALFAERVLPVLLEHDVGAEIGAPLPQPA